LGCLQAILTLITIYPNNIYDFFAMSILKTAHHIDLLMRGLSPNDETIEAYNHRLGWYLKHTPEWYNESHAPLLRWMDFSLEQISQDGMILEIGSGPGRDAKYMRDRGYKVLCSDASRAFVDYMNDNGCGPAIEFNAIKDPVEGKYALVFANAVVPHFTPDDLKEVLRKVREALQDGGLFAFSAKQGAGDKWVDEKLGEKRFVHHWQPDQLIYFIRTQGFEIIYKDQDIPGDLPTHTWTLLTLKKV
jgi:SAM-dependent methyltransferase